ncbi:MAG TPA: efflux RND transporter periplasmic adaptor subunit [Candidatus Coprenecus stercoravium]|uniref:Efflux RND transporter periplasmic adaptor subunit n=1 Tax=Candidatus Coprenecus stercoravium TaxID=2840735 RepID=A0A9D2GSY0_9BACT|nr:efflux RND transporter periplasmic adaptor subunit [Candidatus Coprenecus stercoravium]
MRRALNAIAVTAAAAFFTVAMQGCRVNGASGQKAETVPNVRTSVAQSIGGTRIMTYPGRIQPARDVNLSFRVAGPIAAIHFREGRHVHKGDTLAEIEERDYALQLAATTAKYEQVKAEAGRVIELSDRGSATQNDYDKARYGLEQAAALYHAHQNALNDTKMTAPFDGYVQQVLFEAGETVGAGMPVISLISDGAPIVRVDIPAADFANIDKAVRCWCAVDTYPGRTFELQLIDITKKANLNQLFTARYALTPNADGTMPSPGISTSVCIEYLADGNATVSIPATALFEESGESCVWLLDSDGTVTKRTVITDNIDRNGNARIISGIHAGDTVVSAGVHSLKDGAQVKVLPGKSATNPGNLL